MTCATEELHLLKRARQTRASKVGKPNVIVLGVRAELASGSGGGLCGSHV